MLCEQCGQHQATYHYTSIVNGNKVERHLCEECASKSGTGVDWALGDILAGLLGYMPKTGSVETKEQNVRHCAKCGWTLEQIKKTGLVGCAECYKTFEKELGAVIKHVQGHEQHVGIAPETGNGDNKFSELDTLRTQMSDAVEREDFEQAAVLRDRIRMLEKAHGEQLAEEE